MEEGTSTQLDTEQERPVLAATSGEGDSYKPTVKGNRAGRESEGSIVLTTPAERPDEGRGPALVVPVSGGKRRGMVARPNYPLENVRELQHRLYNAAKCQQEMSFHAV